MALTSFSTLLFLIILIGIFYVWYRYKVIYISNFFLGVIILILLCKFDFLGFEGFEGKGAVLLFMIMILLYSLLNISAILTYYFKNIRFFFFLPISTFIGVSVWLFFDFDPGKYPILKTGILIRLLLSFFPLYILLYYRKRKSYIKKK